MCICRILLMIFTVGQWFSIGTDPIKGILEVVRIFKRVIGILWHKKRNTYLVFAPGSWHKAPKTFPISWVISILLLLLCWAASVVSDSVRPHRRQSTRLPVPGILQARTLEWGAISFSNAWKWKVKVKSLSHVRLLVTPWTAAHQAPPSTGFSRWEYWSGCHCMLGVSYSLCRMVTRRSKSWLEAWKFPHCLSSGERRGVRHWINNQSCLHAEVAIKIPKL